MSRTALVDDGRVVIAIRTGLILIIKPGTSKVGIDVLDNDLMVRF